MIFFYFLQVTHPLCHRNMICARLDAVSEILESMGAMDFNAEYSGTAMVKHELHHVISSALIGLGRSPDIQRGITRIFHRTATSFEVQCFFSFNTQSLN